MENTIKINIDNVYEGPMELLLDLIKENKIDIYDIPIALITDEFIKRLGVIRFSNLDSFLDFSIMAATLLQIKSKMLLPKQVVDEEEIDPRKELIDRLVEYKYFKKLVGCLNDLYFIGDRKLVKNAEDLTILSFEEKIDFKSINAIKLFNTINKLFLKKSFKENSKIINIEEENFTIEECVDLLFKRLDSSNNLNFSSMFNQETSKVEIITYFLTILELIKSQKIIVEQIDEKIMMKRA